jgi:hypothetical protein
LGSAQELALGSAQEPALGSAQELALESAQELALESAQELALESAQELAWSVQSEGSMLQSLVCRYSRNCLNRSRSWQRSKMKMPAAQMLKLRSTYIP